MTKGLSVRLRLRSWNAESALDYLGGDNQIMQALESEGPFRTSMAVEDGQDKVHCCCFEDRRRWPWVRGMWMVLKS